MKDFQKGNKTLGKDRTAGLGTGAPASNLGIKPGQQQRPDLGKTYNTPINPHQPASTMTPKGVPTPGVINKTWDKDKGRR